MIVGRDYRRFGSTTAEYVRLSWQHAFQVLPAVAVELDRKWHSQASAIPDPELRRQALASQRSKRFHAEGGAVYSLVGQVVNPTLVRLIVAIQTISDYLDNLCDRSGTGDPDDFRQLHRAWMDAFSTGDRSDDYYRLHPQREDGGYLPALVRQCQQELRRLPSFAAVAGEVERLAGSYADLQVYKHQLPVERRVPSLEAWHAEACDNPGLFWWEFAAACGSTLGIFALLRAASRPNLSKAEAQGLRTAYFPAICATHILLDYFVDQAEDVLGGDLNLVSYYRSPSERDQRLRCILKTGLDYAAGLPEATFHKWIVTGLPTLYLSDLKVRQQKLQATRKLLVREVGWGGRVLELLIRLHKMSAWGRKTYGGFR